MTLTRYSWTQPCCSTCLDPKRSPVIFAGEPGQESTCCFCGGQALDGLSVRVDPETVKYPTAVRD